MKELLLATMLVLLPASLTHGQCLEGRVVSDQSGGRCCWPGQSWNDDAARCSGPPSCPDGWAGAGDECVRVNAPPSTTVPPVVPDMSTAEAVADSAALEWASSSTGPPDGRLRPRQVRGRDDGLIYAGAITFGVAYAAHAVIATLILATSSGWAGREHFELWFIPGLGGFVQATVSSANYGLTLGLPGAVIETIGIGLFTAGLVERTSIQFESVALRVDPNGGATVAMGGRF